MNEQGLKRTPLCPAKAVSLMDAAEMCFHFQVNTATVPTAVGRSKGGCYEGYHRLNVDVKEV